MFATDEETVLKEFLSEAVVCEGSHELPPHDAEFYVQFSCPECKMQTVGANCDPCWTDFLNSIVRLNRPIPCPDCRVPVDWLQAISVLGPVR